MGFVVLVVVRWDLFGYEHRLHRTRVIQAAAVAAAGQIATVRRASIETRRAEDASIVFALAGERLLQIDELQGVVRTWMHRRQHVALVHGTHVTLVYHAWIERQSGSHEIHRVRR